MSHASMYWVVSDEKRKILHEEYFSLLETALKAADLFIGC